MELQRRSFMKGMGAVSGVAVTGVSFDTIAQAAKAAQPAKGAVAAPAIDIKHVKSGCAICPNFCGIDATVANGIVGRSIQTRRGPSSTATASARRARPECGTRTTRTASRSP